MNNNITKKVLESGRYIIVVRYDEIPLDVLDVTGQVIKPVHEGREKTIVINSMRINYRTGRVRYDITIAENPIPIAIVLVTVGGAALLGAFGYALEEVQQTVDKTWPLVLLMAGVWVYTLYKTR